MLEFTEASNVRSGSCALRHRRRCCDDRHRSPAAKASVLAAMDLGYERGVLEAEHLHVEIYAARMLWRGHERFSEKRKPVWQGR
jgi:hypothetical protein